MRLADAAGIAVALLAGCSSAVSVQAASSSSQCSELIAALPKTLVQQPSRPVNSVGTAAWGNPVITLRCGVAAPAGFGTGLIEVNGVSWFPVELTSGYRFTAKTAAGYIEVTVPSKYAPEADVLVDLSANLR